MRKALHADLDAILRSETETPTGDPVSVLDDLLIRASLGCGVAIRLAAVPPTAAPEPPAPLILVP